MKYLDILKCYYCEEIFTYKIKDIIDTLFKNEKPYYCCQDIYCKFFHSIEDKSHHISPLHKKMKLFVRNLKRKCFPKL